MAWDVLSRDVLSYIRIDLIEQYNPGHMHQRATVDLCLHWLRFAGLCVLYIPV